MSNNFIYTYIYTYFNLVYFNKNRKFTGKQLSQIPFANLIM